MAEFVAVTKVTHLNQVSVIGLANTSVGRAIPGAITECVKRGSSMIVVDCLGAIDLPDAAIRQLVVPARPGPRSGPPLMVVNAPAHALDELRCNGIPVANTIDLPLDKWRSAANDGRPSIVGYRQ